MAPSEIAPPSTQDLLVIALTRERTGLVSASPNKKMNMKFRM